MRKFFLFTLIIFLLPFSLQAQIQPEWDAAKIKLQLEKLNVLGRILYVGAHPDDENTYLLAYLANEKKYRTAYLSLTRGDGGQNLVGDEQGPYIGLMRTEELLAARQNDGAEQFFSHALDFGFSKTAKETFQFWGHQRILSDVVWIIRKFQPDIIICRFPEDKRAGHGNHEASAILAHEAFKEAADSSKFPEQLKWVKTWRAKRILWNTYNFSSINTTSPNQFKIDVGKYNPLLGKGYGEIAAASRSMHKSQGFGTAASYGQHTEYFKTIEGVAPEQTLMDGINTTWERIKGGEDIAHLIGLALQEYDMDYPEKIVPLLLKIRSLIQKIPDTYWRNQKIKEVSQLIIACSGILLEANTSQLYITPGDSLNINTRVINRSSIPVSLQSVTLLNQKEQTNNMLNKNELYNKKYILTIPENISISQPYWLKEPHHAGYYKIPKQQLVGLPKNPPALTARFELSFSGDTLSVIRPIQYKHVDPVRGEIHDRMVIAPPVTANISDEVYLFTSTTTQQIEVKLKSFKDNISGIAHLTVPDNFIIKNNNQTFSLTHSGDEQTLYFTVIPSHKILSSISQNIAVQLQVNGKTYNRGIKIIAHDYIPTITVFPTAESKLVAVPLQTSGQQIGYIMGAGDKVPQALEQMGYQVKLLNDNQFSLKIFQQFDAIVVGIRAYNTRKQLKYAQADLLNYVKQGGTLVVQYNNNQGLVTDNLGPYPFTITRDRVTDETAPVKFLLTKDPVLNIPNKITAKDFDGWIQERGLYFVNKADAHYRKPFAMHDEGEAPLDGSLIVCNYGKGKYVYTSLAFFRELPAGIPGAFRLFANLLSKNKYLK